MESDKIDGYTIHTQYESAFEINDWNGVPCFFGRYRALIEGRCMVKVEFNSAELESAEEVLSNAITDIKIGDCIRIIHKCGDGEIVIGIPYPLTDRDTLWYVKRAIWLCLAEAVEMRTRKEREKEQA